MRTHAEIISHIEASQKKPLPGWEAQASMIPISPINGVEYHTDRNKLKKGAVLISLFEQKGKTHTIFIERTKDSSPHSGQIAFPGGRYEDTDKTQIHTALREAQEEVGIDINSLRVIGKLSPVDITVSGYSVLPVIAEFKGIPKLTPSLDEVKNIFTLPLSDLLNKKTICTLEVRKQIVKTPAYILNGIPVWGATAMALGELQAILS